MKKFLLSIVVLAIVITLGGCFGGAKKASKVTFIIAGKSGTSVLELTPDYGKRTIAATYNSGAPKEDIASAGQIGGEYFDRFGEIVDFAVKYEKSLDVAWPVIPTDPASYSVNVEFKDGKSYKVDWVLYDDSVDEFAEFEAFYIDVTNLLTESEQI